MKLLLSSKSILNIIFIVKVILLIEKVKVIHESIRKKM